jgi:hypothetical protein
MAPTFFHRIQPLWMRHTQALLALCATPIQGGAAPTVATEEQTHARLALLALRCLRHVVIHGLKQSAATIPEAHVRTRGCTHTHTHGNGD